LEEEILAGGIEVQWLEWVCETLALAAVIPQPRGHKEAVSSLIFDIGPAPGPGYRVSSGF
jgi:hypothetical protein